jgi:crossover junction endodeoxyribonuclease RuvC
MIYIGIDPGKTGGMASVNDEGTVLRVDPMPITPQDVYLALLAHKGPIDHDPTCVSFSVVGGIPCNCSRTRYQASKCILEYVSASPQMGVVSAFTFGRGYGNLEAFLVAADIPYDQTTPAKWQDVMQCRSRGDKNVTKARAQQLFPTFKVTHAIADALLIAEYCRRKERGVLK